MLESGILGLGIHRPVRGFLLFIETSAVQAFYFLATDVVRYYRSGKRIPNLDALADPNNSIGLAWCARFLLLLADFSKNMKSLMITYTT